MIRTLETENLRGKTLRKFLTLYPDTYNIYKNIKHQVENTNCDYHLENDLWAHTMMVYNNIELNEKNNILNTLNLIIALTHDYGKIYTREINEKTRRPQFKSHENHSVQFCYDVIYDMFNFDLDTSENSILGSYAKEILGSLLIVNNHMKLYTYLENSRKNKNYNLIDKIMSMYNYNKETAIRAINFGIADKTGSISIDKVDYDILYHMEKLKEDIQYQKGIDEFKNPEFEKYDLVMVAGTSGVGKNTFYETNLRKLGFKLLSYDNITLEKFYEHNNLIMQNDYKYYEDAFNFSFNSSDIDIKQILIDRAVQELKSGNKVAIVNTHLTKKSRRGVINVIKNNNALKDSKYMCIYLMDHSKNIIKKNENRKDKELTKKHYINMMRRQSIPNLSEDYFEGTFVVFVLDDECDI